MCNCQDCGEPIHPLRIEAGFTEYCVKCSDAHTFKYVAHTIYSHKTAGDLFVARTPEGARRLEREAIRGR